jgi:adenosylcobinamide-GDP ribazoletransferase
VTGLLVAARYLTIAPLPGGAADDPEAVGRAGPWFPVVGLAIGAAVSLVHLALARWLPGLLATVVALLLWKVASGGLHLDGLADCLDGLAGPTPEQRLAIMRDSRIGAFGVIGLVFLLLLEAAALDEVAPHERWRVLLAAPVVGRALPALVALAYPAARPDGAGAAFRAGLPPSAPLLTLTVAVLVAGPALGPSGVVGVVVAVGSAVAVGRFMTSRLGGVTGDVHGAVVEVGELVAVMVPAIWRVR